ncbi:MAG: hypothetical protein AAF601_13185 [Pseudomonadota bacterium]
MAYIPQTLPQSIWATIKSYLHAFSAGLAVSAGYEARIRRMDALNAKSDEDLAKMGLRRQDIAAYVFRDLMYH